MSRTKSVELKEILESIKKDTIAKINGFHRKLSVEEIRDLHIDIYADLLKKDIVEDTRELHYDKSIVQ